MSAKDQRCAVSDGETAPSGAAIQIAAEYIDHARQCEVYKMRVPEPLLALFRAVAPTLDLLHQPPMAHEVHTKHYRDVRFYSDAVDRYRYAGQIMPGVRMPPALATAVGSLADHLGVALNGALVNRYNDGHDYIVKHSDAVQECVPQPSVRVSVAGDAAPHRMLPRYPGCPYIVTLSLGASRTFDVIDKATDQVAVRWTLNDGDICVMAGHTQDHYLHMVPAEPDVTGARYSFTIRNHVVDDENRL